MMSDLNFEMQPSVEALMEVFDAQARFGVPAQEVQLSAFAQMAIELPQAKESDGE